MFQDLPDVIKREIRMMLEQKQFAQARALYLTTHREGKIKTHRMVVRPEDLKEKV